MGEVWTQGRRLREGGVTRLVVSFALWARLRRFRNRSSGFCRRPEGTSEWFGRAVNRKSRKL
jgi:hypothetical protein